jgi:hypothetical protein
LNYDQYSNPVVISSPSDPLVSVSVPDSWGWPAGTLQIRVPAGVTGAAGTDASLVIIDGDTAYDLWQFNRTSDTTATTSAQGRANIKTGTGWGTSSPFQGAGIRAAGSSGLAGEIYGNELTTGIHHALAFATPPGVLDGSAVCPAISSDGPAEGTRIAIPAGTPMPTGMSVQGQAVWNALVTYGAFLVDRVGGNAPVILNADPRSVPASDVNAVSADLGKFGPHVQVVNGPYCTP